MLHLSEEENWGFLPYHSRLLPDDRIKQITRAAAWHRAADYYGRVRTTAEQEASALQISRATFFRRLQESMDLTIVDPRTNPVLRGFARFVRWPTDMTWFPYDWASRYFVNADVSTISAAVWQESGRKSPSSKTIQRKWSDEAISRESARCYRLLSRQITYDALESRFVGGASKAEIRKSILSTFFADENGKRMFLEIISQAHTNHQIYMPPASRIIQLIKQRYESET